MKTSGEESESKRVSPLFLTACFPATRSMAAHGRRAYEHLDGRYVSMFVHGTRVRSLNTECQAGTCGTVEIESRGWDSVFFTESTEQHVLPRDATVFGAEYHLAPDFNGL